MGLVEFIILCAVVGLLAWKAAPLIIPPPIIGLVQAVAVLFLVIVLIRAVGLDIPLSRIAR